MYETRDTIFVAIRGTEPSDANDVANDLDVGWANAHSYFGNNACISNCVRGLPAYGAYTAT